MGRNISSKGSNTQTNRGETKITDGGRSTCMVPAGSWVILSVVSVSIFLSFSMGLLTHEFFFSRTSQKLYSLSQIALTQNEKTDSLKFDIFSRQHLVVDMEGINAKILDSEDHLAQAMLSIACKAHLTLRSYHCKRVRPNGVNCVGIGKKQHITFQTFPKNQVLTLNLFGIKASSLSVILSTISNHFGVASNTDAQKTKDGPIFIVSAVKQRGIKKTNVFHGSDLSVLSKSTKFRMKTQIASIKNSNNSIEFFDIIDSCLNASGSYHCGFANDESHETKNQNIFQPDQIIYHDDVMENTRIPHEAYYESLVHPAMFAHEDPHRVAVVGDAQSSVLQEILKHNTVDEVTLVGTEKIMANTSDLNLKPWIHCHDLFDSRAFCIDAPGISMYYENGIQWLFDKSYTSVQGKEKYGRYDIIIVDALFPINTEHDDAYSMRDFFNAVYNMLSDNGIFIMHVSKSMIEDFEFMDFGNVAYLLGEVGMDCIHPYDYFQRGLNNPWQFLLACRDTDCLQNWYRNSAEVEVAIHNRIVRSGSTSRPLQFFDGPTMKQFQIPHKTFEIEHCRKFPFSGQCELYFSIPSRINVPVTSLQVRPSSVGESVGRGLFTTVDIPMGSIIGLEIAPKKIAFYPKTVDRILQLIERLPEAEDIDILYSYMDGYGYETNTMGDVSKFVDGSIITFTNHGCNLTNNIGYLLRDIECHHSQDCIELNEYTFDAEKYANIELWPSSPTYNPVHLRHIEFFESGFDYAPRNISAGEELFQNYLTYEANRESVFTEAMHLKRLCTGEVGDVVEYEQKHGAIQ